MLGLSIAQAQTMPQQGNTNRVISDKDISLLRQDIRSQRKQLIAANLKLTEGEATSFWPIYDQYLAEMITINDKRFAMIQDYADNRARLTNEDALLLTRQWLDMDIALTQLRQKYVPMVAKVLEGRKAATFFQLDRRIGMILDLQVSSQMPLVQENTGQSSSRDH